MPSKPLSRVKSPIAMIDRRPESRSMDPVAGQADRSRHHHVGRAGRWWRCRLRPDSSRCRTADSAPPDVVDARRAGEGTRQGRPLQPPGCPGGPSEGGQQVGAVHGGDDHPVDVARRGVPLDPLVAPGGTIASIRTTSLVGRSASSETPRMIPAKVGSSEKTRTGGSEKTSAIEVGPLGDQAAGGLVGDVPEASSTACWTATRMCSATVVEPLTTQDDRRPGDAGPRGDLLQCRSGHAQAVPADHLEVPLRAVLRHALLRRVVDVDQAEALVVPVGPLVVVQEAPDQVSAQVDALGRWRRGRRGSGRPGIPCAACRRLGPR